jgi:predicted nucleic acid-binding protein
MQEESSGYEGVIDVGVLVPCCFENPLKQESIDFLQETLLEKRRVLLPVSAVIGAYHIATNYLGVSRVSAKMVFTELLRTGSKALYQEIGSDLASNALDYSATLSVDPWDGYVVALATKFGANVVFSLDQELGEHLKEQKEVGLPVVVNPFRAKKVREYHRFLDKNA